MAQLARRLRPGCKKDQRILAGWYDSTDGVHHPYDVLIAQEQNLGWDARLRRRYASLVLAAAVIWSGLGLIAGLVIAGRHHRQHACSASSSPPWPSTRSPWKSGQASSGSPPNASASTTGDHRTPGNARPGTISNSEWRRLREVARDIQDGILRTRLDASRVPEWFYRRYRNRDELDFADTAEGHRRRLSA